MSQALKATAILAAMVILQLVWDNFRRLKPDVPLFSAGGWSWLPLAALILSAVAIFAIFGYRKFAEDIEEIESWLTLAERELLRFMRDAWDPAAGWRMWRSARDGMPWLKRPSSKSSRRATGRLPTKLSN